MPGRWCAAPTIRRSGSSLDTFHTFARKTDLKPIRSIPGDRIFLVQLADAPWLDMDVLSWSRHFRCFPGQGDLPLLDFMEAVPATGYEGDLSLEIFNDQFRAGSPRSVAVDGQRSLVYLMDQLRAKSGKAVADVPPMPPRSKCLGVEFIEFAVDDRTADELDAVHRRPRLPQRGAAQVEGRDALDAGRNQSGHQQREGRLRAFALHHARAVGLRHRPEGRRVRPQRSTAPRSCTTRRSARRSGRASWKFRRCAASAAACSISSIRPASSAKVWDIEFEPVAAGKRRRSRPHGCRPHLAVDALRGDAVLAAVLHVAARRAKTPQVDIIDPGGIVRSQVVETADGTLRIALNASQSTRTQSSRFLNEYFGSGVQHIAFATDDIVATVARLRANGVETLRIPENYYDDLEARVDLGGDRLKMLKANNILYDKDDKGEYFQLYTQSFEDLFFFEIVQRRGYKGFGAINAPIRLNAQSRLAGEQTVPGL